MIFIKLEMAISFSVFQNFEAEVHKLAEFLSLSRDESFFRDLSKKCNFATMQRDKTKVGYSEVEKQQWRNGEVRFLRKGET